MDKIKHPKRYEAYQNGFANGKAASDVFYKGRISELEEQLKSSKESIIRIVFEDNKAINELEKVKEAYRYKYTPKSIDWEAWFWFIAGVVLTNIFYFAINNTLV